MTIGIAISGLLKANASLLALVNTDNIFPYVANPDTALPLIVYTIDSLSADYDKDGWVGDDCTFSVISVSDDYSNLQLIATQVRAALELSKYSGTQRIELTGMEETAYQSGIFENTLHFSYRIFDYTGAVAIPYVGPTVYYQIKYSQTVTLTTLTDNDITTTLTTSQEPYNVMLLDTSGNDITATVTIRILLTGGFWHVWVYNGGATLTGVKLKILY